MKKQITRVHENEFCTLEVELRTNRDGKPVLSICGTAGYVTSRASAKKEALQYWVSYFEDNPSAIGEMNERCRTRFRTPKTAARYVIAQDGDFHGLDVHKELGSRVYVLTSCGQIREEIADFFPEAVPYFHWHLNDMRPSPARVEQKMTANGGIVDVQIPEGAEWVYEPLPANVLAWFENLQGE